MSKKIKLILVAISLTFLPLISLAATTSPSAIDLLQKTGQANYDTATPKSPVMIINQFIQIALSFLGVLFLILIIWSGFQWMTSGGNGEVIKKAKAKMINATIGLAIILLAYSITYFISKTLFDLTTTAS